MGENTNQIMGLFQEMSSFAKENKEKSKIDVLQNTKWYSENIEKRDLNRRQLLLEN
jgi:hypothetical protein